MGEQNSSQPLTTDVGAMVREWHQAYAELMGCCDGSKPWDHVGAANVLGRARGIMHDLFVVQMPDYRFAIIDQNDMAGPFTAVVSQPWGTIRMGYETFPEALAVVVGEVAAEADFYIPDGGPAGEVRQRAKVAQNLNRAASEATRNLGEALRNLTR